MGRRTGRPPGRPRTDTDHLRVLGGEDANIDDLDLTYRSRPMNGYQRQRLDTLIEDIAANDIRQAVIALPDGTLVSGYLRILALRALGATTVPVVVVGSHTELFAALDGEFGSRAPWDLETLVQVDEIVKMLGKMTMKERADRLGVTNYQLQQSRRLVAAAQSDNPERANLARLQITAVTFKRTTLREAVRAVVAIPEPHRVPRFAPRRTLPGSRELEELTSTILTASRDLRATGDLRATTAQAGAALKRLREAQRLLKQSERAITRANPIRQV